MPCVSMFSRFKGGGSSQNLLEGNTITTYFEVGRQTASAGPGLLWKIHDAYRKSDGKVKKKKKKKKKKTQHKKRSNKKIKGQKQQQEQQKKKRAHPAIDF